MTPQCGAENPFLHFDGLYCEEERIDETLSDDGADHENVEDRFKSSFLQNDCYEEDEIKWLIKKEEDTQFYLIKDSSSMTIRTDAVLWILKANSYHGFSALTAVLAVNYLDRFVSSFGIHEDKPWMGQLTAVACLSLAAKVEETDVPLLLDLQINESDYVFQAKTIQRMELLVLSTLQWRMNPVTPISFLDYLMRRFKLEMETLTPWEFRRRCERLLLSILPEEAFLFHSPSVITTGIMMYIVKEIEPVNAVEFLNRLMGFLHVSKDKVDDCHKFMLELSKVTVKSAKYKHPLPPGSPTGVIDVTFSSDSSNDSWAGPPSKKSRINGGYV